MNQLWLMRFGIGLVVAVAMLSGCFCREGPEAELIQKSKQKRPEWIGRQPEFFSQVKDGDLVSFVFIKKRVNNIELGIRQASTEIIDFFKKEVFQRMRLKGGIKHELSKPALKFLAEQAIGTSFKTLQIVDTYFEQVDEKDCIGNPGQQWFTIYMLASFASEEMQSLEKEWMNFIRNKSFLEN